MLNPADEANEELEPDPQMPDWDRLGKLRQVEAKESDDLIEWYEEGERPRLSPKMLPKRDRQRYPGHSHQRR